MSDNLFIAGLKEIKWLLGGHRKDTHFNSCLNDNYLIFDSSLSHPKLDASEEFVLLIVFSEENTEIVFAGETSNVS